jgi:alkanesulfonate monooxygenase SsuD/methylene tetrahydromethanopterin reductase-like flavin-dependent oxidoreductase (luciferase family)
VLLARSLAALDQVSGGRLTVGLGLGWSIDEFDAVGAPMARRGHRLEEILDVLGALWTTGTSAVATTHERVTASIVGVKPVQVPAPPLLLAAFNPAGLDRIARRGDGWIPFGVPIGEIGSHWAQILEAAERYGRDPASLQLVVRADPIVTQARRAVGRPAFSGTWQQIRDDIDRVRDLGADELILDLQTTARDVDELMDMAERLTRSNSGLLAA